MKLQRGLPICLQQRRKTQRRAGPQDEMMSWLVYSVLARPVSVLIVFMSQRVHLPSGSKATEYFKINTVERSDVILLYFFLEEELSEPKHSLGVLVDRPVIDALLDLLQTLLVLDILMQVTLRVTLPVGLEGIEDTSIAIPPCECKHLNYLQSKQSDIIIVMDRSNSNSEQSNFFVISSESSRSERKKKEEYRRFVERVRELVELQGGDLEELYGRVENIVRKYFYQHRVVDFKEMYDSLLGIRSNSKKMREVVALLEGRLGGGRVVEREERSVKSQYFQTTVGSRKTKNSLGQSKEEDNHNVFFEGEAVNTSGNFNHVLKPMKGRESQHEMTPKIQRSNQSEHTPSPMRQSPSKLNISGEEYLNRNKQYQAKVKEMMRELQEIKMKIKQRPAKQDLMLELRQNGDREQEVKEVKQEQAKAEEMSNKIIEASQHSIHSSQLSHKSQQKSSIQQLQTHSIPIIHQQSIPAKNTINPAPRNTSLLDIMKNTQNITKQIQQLKQVASRLQLNSNPSRTDMLESQTSIYPADKINQLIKKASQNKKNQPLLEEMDNTTSQMELSDGIIPSFKKIDENSSQKYEIIPGAVQVSSKQQLSQQRQQNQSNTAQNALSSSQVITSFYPNQQKVQSAATVKYIYNPYPQNNYQNQSVFTKPSSYRPVPVFQPTTSVPVQRIYVDQNPKPIQLQQPIQLQSIQQPIQPQPIQTHHSMKIAPNVMMVRPSPVLALSPQASNNSSTSIMHPHLFNKSASFSHLHSQPYPNNPSIISANTSSLQNRSTLSLKTSQSSSTRKGLNLTSPPNQNP